MDVLSFFRDLIRKYEKSDPQDARDSLRCVPYIKCWTCLDTECLLFDRWAPSFLGYSPYEVKRCKTCQGNDNHVRYADSNRETERGRPIPYHGNWSSSPYTERDLIRALADMYRRDYQHADEVEETKYANMSDAEVLACSQWGHIQTSRIDQHLREWELEVDVKKVVDGVSTAVQVYSGNVLMLVDMISTMKVKFGLSTEQSAVEESVSCVDISERSGQPFFMKMSYRMTDDRDGLDVGFLNYYKTTKHFRGELTLMRPENGASVEICRRMMNREAGKVFLVDR